MGCCGRAAPLLLLQVNLIIMVFAGGALAMAARLKWDPSAYVPARELFPQEYQVLAVALPSTALAAILLANLVLFALRCRRPLPRRILLVLYAVSTLLLAIWEAVLGTWVVVRVQGWLQTEQAADVKHALQISDHLQPLLEQLAYFHPLPQKIKNIIQESETDAPVYSRVILVASGAALALQLIATLLALVAAFSGPARARARPRPPSLSETETTTTPVSVRRGERAPLRAVYKQGRLVMM